VNIAFLGGGNMANALIGGLVAKGFEARAISVIELAPAARDKIAAHGVRVSTAPDAASAKADTLVLAVKPQDARAALASVASSVDGKLVISIAAGVRLDALSRWLGGHRRLVRCMPNTPALIGAGIAGLYALPEVTADERARAQTILGAVGEVVWLNDERLLDPVTAVSGSGPAYVFWFIEQLAATLADYLVPCAAELPAIKIVHMHTPTPHTEYGVKGMGEGGAIAPPAAIANAVRDALAPLGAEVNETPLTPRRVLAAIRQAQASQASQAPSGGRGDIRPSSPTHGLP